MDQLEGPFFFLLTDFFFVKKLEIRVEEAQLYINDLIKNWYDLMDVIEVFE